MSWGKYVLAAFVVAVAAHLAAINALPVLAMNAAMERLSGDGARINLWNVGDRVTENSRAIVRPSPDFAYSACVYDLSRGPLRIAAAPWRAYWSLSLYGDNGDNYFVLDDREAHDGAELTLVRAGAAPPEGAAQVVESPSRRGVAILRRLAPSVSAYNDARAVARGDACEMFRAPAGA